MSSWVVIISIISWKTPFTQKNHCSLEDYSTFCSTGQTGRENVGPFKITLDVAKLFGELFDMKKYAFAFKATCCPLCTNKLASTKTFLSIAKNWAPQFCFCQCQKDFQSFQIKSQQRSKVFTWTLHASEIQMLSFSPLQ